MKTKKAAQYGTGERKVWMVCKIVNISSWTPRLAAKTKNNAKKNTKEVPFFLRFHQLELQTPTVTNSFFAWNFVKKQCYNLKVDTQCIWTIFAHHFFLYIIKGLVNWGFVLHYVVSHLFFSGNMFELTSFVVLVFEINIIRVGIRKISKIMVMSARTNLSSVIINEVFFKFFWNEMHFLNSMSFLGAKILGVVSFVSCFVFQKLSNTSVETHQTAPYLTALPLFSSPIPRRRRGECFVFLTKTSKKKSELAAPYCCQKVVGRRER